MSVPVSAVVCDGRFNDGSAFRFSVGQNHNIFLLTFCKEFPDFSCRLRFYDGCSLEWPLSSSETLRIPMSMEPSLVVDS